MSDDPIGDAARKQLAERMDDMILRQIAGPVYTSSVPEPAPSLDINKLLPEWEKMLRNARRSQVTVVCDLGHDGPILMHDTPVDGKRVECSWPQLLALHRHWPMKLHTVNSPEQAEFVPISGVFNELVPMWPDPPPWFLPDDDLPKPLEE